MKQYVFIPCVELEFWLLLSTAQQLKELYPDRKQTLISLSHIRLAGKFEDEKKYFDEVIEFPWFQPSIKHGLKTFFLSHQFSKLLSQTFPKNSAFICCGFGQFMHHHILNCLTKKQWHYINIQLFPSTKQSTLAVFNWRFSFINSLFFFFRFGYLSCYFFLKNSKIISKIVYTYLYKKHSPPHQTLVNINHDYHPFHNASYIDHCPNPYLFLDAPISKSFNLKTPCILILLTDNISQKTPTYYPQASALIDYLHQHFPSHTIYVKFHPQIQDNFESITSPHYQQLDKTISAETLFLSNPGSIDAVLGSYSTALAVATDFGIKAYDCSRFFGIDAPAIFEQYASKHYTNKPVTYINNTKDLSLIQGNSHSLKQKKNSLSTFRQLLQRLDTLY